MLGGKSFWTAGDIVGLCVVALVLEMGLVVAFAASRKRARASGRSTAATFRNLLGVLLVLTLATGVLFFFMAVAIGLAN